jgi:hypothetical protein
MNVQPLKQILRRCVPQNDIVAEILPVVVLRRFAAKTFEAQLADYILERLERLERLEPIF